jgi:hypothetical protein
MAAKSVSDDVALSTVNCLTTNVELVRANTCSLCIRKAAADTSRGTTW